MMTMMTRHDHHYGLPRGIYLPSLARCRAVCTARVELPAKPAMLGVVDSGQLRHRVPKRLAQVRGRARSRSRRAQALTTH